MSLPSEVSLTPTRPLLRVARLGNRRLTRAHLALHRTALADAARDLVGPLSAAVSEQVASELRLEARLLDGAFLPRQTLSRISGYAVLELSAADATAILEVELPFLVALLGRVAGAPQRLGAVTSFTRIEEAAFGLVSLVALNAVRRHGALEAEFAPRLSALTTERAEVLARVDADQPHVAVSLRLLVGNEVGAGRLLVPARVLQVIAERFPTPQRVDAIESSVATARIRARLLCGGASLTDGELASLQEGDVVLFENVTLAGGQLHGAARLVAPLFTVTGELTPAGFVSRRGSPRGLTPESVMSSAAPSAEPFPPLPVELEVELTRVHLAVSELATLRPGALIPLHVNASEPVLLRIGDRAVARAELVEIEGEVGARILSLLP